MTPLPTSGFAYGLTLGWGYAISKGSEMQLGLWGWYLAKYLAATHGMASLHHQLRGGRHAH